MFYLDPYHRLEDYKHKIDTLYQSFELTVKSAIPLILFLLLLQCNTINLIIETAKDSYHNLLTWLLFGILEPKSLSN